jgi:hypothetical protein
VAALYQLLSPAAVHGKEIVNKVSGEVETAALAVLTWQKVKDGYSNGVGADIALGHLAFDAAHNGKKNVQTLVQKQKNGGILPTSKGREVLVTSQNIISVLAAWALHGVLDQTMQAKAQAQADG